MLFALMIRDVRKSGKTKGMGRRGKLGTNLLGHNSQVLMVEIQQDLVAPLVLGFDMCILEIRSAAFINNHSLRPND